jgi:hypothetical protein
MTPRTPNAGLCAICLHARIVESGRGSRFYLCQRSQTDPRFKKYPALPVLRCAGFEDARGNESETQADAPASND